MSTAEVFFILLFPLGLGYVAGDFRPHNSLYLELILNSYWKRSPGHISTCRGTQNIPHQVHGRTLRSCVKLTDTLSNRQERLHMTNYGYLYLWVWILKMPGLSPFYFIIFPLLETEEQKSIAWVLASYWKLKGHAFQFQLKKHSGWTHVIHQTPVG